MRLTFYGAADFVGREYAEHEIFILLYESSAKKRIPEL